MFKYFPSFGTPCINSVTYLPDAIGSNKNKPKRPWRCLFDLTSYFPTLADSLSDLTCDCLFDLTAYLT